MSKDHPVSAQLISEGAIVEGFPWLGGERRACGLNSLGVRCLCAKHNSLLHRLDDAAGQLSRHLDEFVSVFAIRRRAGFGKNHFLRYWEQDGVLLERWCGKFLCTTLAGGLYPDQLPVWTPPKSLVEFIFGKTALPPTAGLFFRGREGEVRTNSKVWGIMPLGKPSNVEGAGIIFRSLRFAFLIHERQKVPTKLKHDDGAAEDLMHHPRVIIWNGANLELRFNWHE